MTRGEHMRKARRKAGLTLRELAQRSGLGYNSISQIELGKREPNIVTAELLADALGLTIDEYVGHERKE